MNYKLTMALERLTFMHKLFNELAAKAREEETHEDELSDFSHGLAAGRRIAYELAANQAKAEISGFNFIAAQEVK
jgi:hypothetical protein